MRGETTQFVASLKTKGFTPPPPRLLMNSRPLKTKASMLFLLNIPSYTTEDVEKFKSLAQRDS